jgi:hypothetical protein
VNTVEVVALQQGFVGVPGHVARLGHDLLVGRCGNEAALGFLEIEIALVLQRQCDAQALLQFDRELRRRLSFRKEMLWLLTVYQFRFHVPS